MNNPAKSAPQPGALPVRGSAAVITGPRSFRCETIAFPPPAPGDVRIRVEGCGVCASNLPIWQGRPWFDYPLPAGAPGHEGWGRIEAIGSDTGGLRVGDRVAFLSEQAYAAYALVPAGQVMLLPESLDDQDFPGEPLSCAVNIFRRCGIAPGQSVAIVGIGFLGAILTSLATGAGAWVVALGRRPFARELARQLGAIDALDSSQPDTAIAQALERAEGDGYDCVIEAAGEQSTLDLASTLVRTRGRLVIAGYHQDGPRQIDMQQWNWRGLDVINAHERDSAVYLSAMAAAAAAVERNALNLEPLLTHRLPLTALPEAFDLLEQRPHGFLKAVVLP